MNDPFDVLRRPPAPVRSQPDESFRAALLAESRRRLMEDPSDSESAARHNHDPATPTLLEPTDMPNANDLNRRPLFLAVASVVLVAIGVAATLTWSDQTGPEAAPVEVSGGVAVEPTGQAPAATSTTSTAGTTAPSTVAPPATPSTSATSAVAAIPDAAELTAALLPGDAWGDGWTALDPTTDYRDVTFEPAVMSSQCSKYENDVYAPMSQATSADRVWLSPEPVSDFAQHNLAVLASADQAATTFAAIADPAFRECARTQGRMFEALKTDAPSDAPFDIDADEFVFYRYKRDLTRDVTRSYSAVLARVGRVIVYIDTFTGLDGDDTELNAEQLSAIVDAALITARTLDA